MKRRWKKANPEAVAICWAKRRERKASSPSPEQRAEMLAIYKECRQRNADAGSVAFHVDHIIPLAKGGAHLPENLQILPAEENLRKGAKLPAQM
jgi:5-methylcytosine-specific restriction endonuclease McrA